MKTEQLARNIRLCQKGRPEGFTRLLERYGRRLYGYFLATSGSPSDAEDLVQELFVVLMEKIADYRHTGRFEQWLFRIAANMARDRARRLTRQATVPLGQVEQDRDSRASTANKQAMSANIHPRYSSPLL